MQMKVDLFDGIGNYAVVKTILDNLYWVHPFKKAVSTGSSAGAGGGRDGGDILAQLARTTHKIC